MLVSLSAHVLPLTGLTEAFINPSISPHVPRVHQRSRKSYQMILIDTIILVPAGGMDRSIYFGPDALKDLYHFDHSCERYCVTPIFPG